MRKDLSKELTTLEEMMSSSLQPVDPRPEFVKKLHHRLTDPLTPSIRYPQDSSLRYLLLFIVGIFSGLIFIITFAQIISSFIKESRLTKSFKGQSRLELE
jgi:hypothetical protein